MGNRESGIGNDDSGTGDGEPGTGSNGGASPAPQRSDSASVDEISRRTWLKLMGLTGAASVVSGALDAAGAMMPTAPNGGTVADSVAASDLAAGTAAEVLPLTSTSDVFVPPRGDAFMKFSFDFPEPSVAFGGLRFGFLVF